MVKRGIQKEKQEGFKMVKLKSNTYKELINLINKKEIKEPYLKGLISFDAIINMLILKNEIKLSKYRFLKKDEKEVKE